MIFSYSVVSRKIGFNKGDNLHEGPKPISGKKYLKVQSSDLFTHHAKCCRPRVISNIYVNVDLSPRCRCTHMSRRYFFLVFKSVFIKKHTT